MRENAKNIRPIAAGTAAGHGWDKNGTVLRSLTIDKPPVWPYNKTRLRPKNFTGETAMRKISKRAKLYLANGICFCSLAGMYLYCSIMLMPVSLFLLVLLMCGFTFFSLIVYYLSIIADAISRRYKDRMAEEEKAPKTK